MRNNVLGILALLGVFAALDLYAHRDVSYFWVKLGSLFAFSTACLLATRERAAWDTFAAVMAALFALGAVAMLAAGARAHVDWWLFFLGFVAAAILFTFLTRKKRETLMAIGAIVGLRLAVFVVRFGLHR